MPSLPKKYIYIYIYIYIIILVVIIIAVILFYQNYNKSTSIRDSLSFKVTNTPNSEKLVATILLLAPTNGQFYVGDTISVSLFVNTLNQSVNVVEGKITFPADKLEVINISKEDSIISLWAQEPTHSSKQNGVVTFSGGLPSPGFVGIAGKILAVSFKVKSVGDAMIDIENAQVLANDGVGTNVLAKIVPTHITLLKPLVKREVADINEDGRVDMIDFSILLTNWGNSKNKRVDFNDDGKVGAKDLSTLLSKWSH